MPVNADRLVNVDHANSWVIDRLQPPRHGYRPAYLSRSASWREIRTTIGAARW